MTATIIRVLLYILSPLFPMAAGYLSGWGVTYDAAAGGFFVDPEMIISSLVVGIGGSLAVLRKWGKW